MIRPRLTNGARKHRRRVDIHTAKKHPTGDTTINDGLRALRPVTLFELRKNVVGTTDWAMPSS